MTLRELFEHIKEIVNESPGHADAEVFVSKDAEGNSFRRFHLASWGTRYTDDSSISFDDDEDDNEHDDDGDCHKEKQAILVLWPH